MDAEPMIVGACFFPGMRYVTWPLVSVGVEERGFRVGGRFWPVLLFGFLDADRTLVEFSRASRSVLIPWSNVRAVELRKANALALTLVDGWKLTFSAGSRSLEALVEDAQGHARDAARAPGQGR